MFWYINIILCFQIHNHLCCYFCSKKDISAGNFTIHEVHCIRNITLCLHCDIPIAKSDLDYHIAELHTKVTCPHCSALLLKSEVDQHIADAHTTEPCPECGENILRNLLEDHERDVHSTTACPLCQRVIKKTNLQQHQAFTSLFIVIYHYLGHVCSRVKYSKEHICVELLAVNGLYCLPIRQHVTFKLSMIVKKCLSELVLPYLANNCMPVLFESCWYPEACLLVNKMVLDGRDFAVSSAFVWNSLSISLRVLLLAVAILARQDLIRPVKTKNPTTCVSEKTKWDWRTHVHLENNCWNGEDGFELLTPSVWC